jgi:hypothetical protein
MLSQAIQPAVPSSDDSPKIVRRDGWTKDIKMTNDGYPTWMTPKPSKHTHSTPPDLRLYANLAKRQTEMLTISDA